MSTQAIDVSDRRVPAMGGFNLTVLGIELKRMLRNRRTIIFTLVMPVLLSWKCEVYVSTRGVRHQQEAAALGAKWVGDAFDLPPERLDAVVIFAPVGSVFLAGLKSLDKGGIVAINAIHLDRMPAFDYDSLLWEERQIRSVANMTRRDAKDFLRIAGEIGITPAVKTFRLDEANEALQAIKDEDVIGSAVLVP